MILIASFVLGFRRRSQKCLVSVILIEKYGSVGRSVGRSAT